MFHFKLGEGITCLCPDNPPKLEPKILGPLCFKLDFSINFDISDQGRLEFVNKFLGKLPLTPMNYKALAICPHELPSVIPDPTKLPNPSQQPSFISQLY